MDSSSAWIPRVRDINIATGMTGQTGGWEFMISWWLRCFAASDIGESIERQGGAQMGFSEWAKLFTVFWSKVEAQLVECQTKKPCRQVQFPPSATFFSQSTFSADSPMVFALIAYTDTQTFLSHCRRQKRHHRVTNGSAQWHQNSLALSCVWCYKYQLILLTRNFADRQTDKYGETLRVTTP